MSEFTDRFKKELNITFSYDIVRSYSSILPTVYSKYIEYWWNKDKYNWGYSNLLAVYCSDDFSIWWDPERFYWDYKNALVEYCMPNVLTWFDKSKIDIWKLDPKSIVLLKKHNLI